jgi:hypothetical protein
MRCGLVTFAEKGLIKRVFHVGCHPVIAYYEII